MSGKISKNKALSDLIFCSESFIMLGGILSDIDVIKS